MDGLYTIAGSVPRGYAAADQSRNQVTSSDNKSPTNTVELRRMKPAFRLIGRPSQIKTRFPLHNSCQGRNQGGVSSKVVGNGGPAASRDAFVSLCYFQSCLQAGQTERVSRAVRSTVH